MRIHRISALLVVSMFLVSLPAGSFSRSNQTSGLKADLPGTIDGSIDPSGIPDAVAYQIFLRASSTSSSSEFIKKAGLDDQQAKTLLNLALSVVEILDHYDTAINSGEQYRVPALQQLREKYVANVVAGLSKSLGDALAARMNNYVRAEIKGKTKRIPLDIILKKEQSNLTSVYTYCDSWRENGFVYGVSVIMPDNEDLRDMVFEARTTILAPGGVRSSSSSTSGSPAAVDLTRLLVGKNDGEYTVASSFAVNKASHKHKVGGSVHTLDVAQTVSIGTASPANQGPINATTGVATITATITTTLAVPSTAVANVELDEVENISGVIYNVFTVDNNMETSGRGQTVHLAGGGASKTVTWRIKTTTANQTGGSIISKVVLDSAFACEPNTQGCSNPPDIKTAPTNSGNVTVTVAAPTVGSNYPFGCGSCDYQREIDCAAYNGFWSSCCCYSDSPIVIDTLGNGFVLTDASGGVDFDFDGNGTAERLAWTVLRSDDAWLVLDRNGNGAIDNGQELFGKPHSPAGSAG
jgi:hypothetical protein